MEVERVDDPAVFLERATPLLLSSEARHNLILGIAGTLVAHPDAYPSHELWTVTEDDRCVAATARTPPYHLILADTSDEAALNALVDALASSASAIPGVIGNRPTVDAFVQRWRRATGTDTHVEMDQGVFEARSVRSVPRTAGDAIPAGSDDRGIVRDWLRAFEVEALRQSGVEEEEPEEMAREDRILDSRLSGTQADAGYWLFRVDDVPVSLAGFGGQTPNGIRVNAVYTPPRNRRRGYATTLVAALTEHLLSGDRRFCFLYTDLANPTSNAIYERIGYRMVCESAAYAFSG